MNAETKTLWAGCMLSWVSASCLVFVVHAGPSLPGFRIYIIALPLAIFAGFLLVWES